MKKFNSYIEISFLGRTVFPVNFSGTSEEESDQDSSDEDGPQLPVTRFETTRNATKTPDHDRSDEQNSTVATTERATTTYVPTTTERVTTTTTRRSETILHEGSGSGTFNDI